MGKVPRYDDNYRDCGLLNQMGGIGARSDTDFSTLVEFVEEPWSFPWPTEDEVVETQRHRFEAQAEPADSPSRVAHSDEEEEEVKLPRRRQVTEKAAEPRDSRT